MQVPMDVRGIRSSAAGVRGAGNLAHPAISTGLFSVCVFVLVEAQHGKMSSAT